jgi:hypothetical protein
MWKKDRQTDMTKLIVAFCNSANMPKILQHNLTLQDHLHSLLTIGNHTCESWDSAVSRVITRQAKWSRVQFLARPRDFSSVPVYGLKSEHVCDDTAVQGCTNSGHQIAQVTKFCILACNIHGSLARNLLHVTLWCLEFWGGIQLLWKICGPLLQWQVIIKLVVNRCSSVSDIILTFLACMCISFHTLSHSVTSQHSKWFARDTRTHTHAHAHTQAS